MKYLKILLLCLFVSFSQIVKSQSLKETIDLAKYYQNNKNYKRAIFYYHRILCFGDESYKKQAYINISDCYYLLGMYSKAYSYYDLAYFIVQNDSLKDDILFKKVSSLILESNFNLALVELYDSKNYIDKNYMNRKNYYLGTIHYLINSFDSSRIYFSKIILHKYKPKLDSLITVAQRINTKKIKKAKIRSRIIPGWGQWYLGYKKDAINSAVLNALLTGLSVFIGIKYGWLDAVLSIAPWIYRYYTGGIHKVENYAKQSVNTEKEQILKKIIYLIQTSNKQ